MFRFIKNLLTFNWGYLFCTEEEQLIKKYFLSKRQIISYTIRPRPFVGRRKFIRSVKNFIKKVGDPIDFYLLNISCKEGNAEYAVSVLAKNRRGWESQRLASKAPFYVMRVREGSCDDLISPGVFIPFVSEPKDLRKSELLTVSTAIEKAACNLIEAGEVRESCEECSNYFSAACLIDGCCSQCGAEMMDTSGLDTPYKRIMYGLKIKKKKKKNDSKKKSSKTVDKRESSSRKLGPRSDLYTPLDDEF